MIDIKPKMEKTIDDFSKKISGLRTNRAKPDMISNIQVSYYGSFVPIQQLCSISVPDSSQFVLNVFDVNSIKDIEKAISQSQLELTPQTDGNSIRIILPELTEERRINLVKLLKQMAEESKVSIRHIRRAQNDEIKVLEKEKEITEDESKKYQNDIQNITEEYTKKIDTITIDKEKEIMTL